MWLRIQALSYREYSRLDERIAIRYVLKREIDTQPGTLTRSPQQGRAALAACTIAIITGTTLINGTFDEVCAGLKEPRAAVLLGPSSPLCADVFSGTGITHMAGSRVVDAGAILRIVSEGGGTMLMKRHLAFETILTDTR